MTNYYRRLLLTLVPGVLMALLAACRPVTATPGAVTVAPDAAATTAATSAATPTLSASDQQLVDAALAQVSQTANVAPADIHLRLTVLLVPVALPPVTI